MAGFDYGRMQSTATRLLQRFAQGNITLSQTTTAPGPNEWTPGTETTATYPLDAAVAAVLNDEATAKFVDGTVIVATDLTVTFAVPEVVPAMGDSVTIDGKVHVVKKIVALPAAGTTVAYKIIVQG